MNKFLKCLTVIFFCSALPIYSQVGKPNCSLISKTIPSKFIGKFGNSEKDKYWFEHAADVEELKNSTPKQYEYLYTITNKSSTYFLPIEWKKAGITFDLIEDECGNNSFSSTLPWKPDNKAPLLFGPTKQYSKKASIYIEEDTTVIFKNNAPIFISSISIGSEKERQYRVYFNFQSTHEGDSYTYSVSNYGTDEIIFKIPRLNQELERLGGLTEMSIESKWEKSEQGFVLMRNTELQPFTINVSQSDGYKEKTMRVKIFNTDLQEVASGRVTFCFPYIVKK